MRAGRWLAVVALAVLALAGCGGGDAHDQAPGETVIAQDVHDFGGAGFYGRQVVRSFSFTPAADGQIVVSAQIEAGRVQGDSGYALSIRQSINGGDFKPFLVAHSVELTPAPKVFAETQTVAVKAGQPVEFQVVVHVYPGAPTPMLLYGYQLRAVALQAGAGG